MSDPLDPKVFLEGYVAEADENLMRAIDRLLSLERVSRSGLVDARAVRDLLRALHTIKGLSAMVDVQPIVELSHAMETLVRACEKRGGAMSVAAVEVLLTGARSIEQLLAAVSKHEAVPQPPAELLDALVQAEPDGAAPTTEVPGIDEHPDIAGKLDLSDRNQLSQGMAEGRRTFRIDFVPSPERSEQGISIQTVRERLEQVGDIVKIVPLGVPRSEQVPGGIKFAILLLSNATPEALAEAVFGPVEAVVPIATGAKQPPPSPDILVEDTEDFRAVGTSTIRVDIKRLDAALDSLSALVVSRFRLERALADLQSQGADVRQLRAVLEETGRQLRALRSAFMLARMVPVAEMLQRVPLLVRQMAASSGKLVKLRIDVGQVELDKGVSDRVFPAVVHLLRNAIDHGIETPEHREHAGKPREGRLSVTCIERGSSLLELTVEDDGSGIDAVHVASAAHAPVPEDTHGLLDVLTSPGFSTSRTVTHTSGRGFGMNIVRDIAVNQLRGQLTLRTTPGSGSAFTLLMPLTLSIIDAFSFCCSDQFFVVPVSMVERVVEIEPRHVLPVPSDKQGEEQRLHLLSYRDDVVPLISLGDLLGLEHRQSQMRTALVVRRDEDAFAFEVDRLVGQHEAVVRPLDDALLRVAGVSGAADLGNGVPTLVLDLVALAESFDGSPQEIAR